MYVCMYACMAPLYFIEQNIEQEILYKHEHAYRYVNAYIHHTYIHTSISCTVPSPVWPVVAVLRCSTWILLTVLRILISIHHRSMLCIYVCMYVCTVSTLSTSMLSGRCMYRCRGSGLSPADCHPTP